MDWVVRAYCTLTERYYYWCDGDGEWTPLSNATRYSTWAEAEFACRQRLADYGMSRFAVEST